MTRVPSDAPLSFMGHAALQARCRLLTDRRPAEGDRDAGARHRARRQRADAAGRHRHGQDDDDGGDDRGRPAPGADHRPQQDARGAALQRVPDVLPDATRSSTSSPTTTTTSPRPTSRRKDLYIEKDSAINQEIDRLRHAATASLFARRDVIIVASVSCIFGLGSPETYNENCQVIVKGGDVDRDELLRKLVSLQYNRNDTALGRGTFRVRGETLEVFPAYEETAFRVLLFGDEVERLQHFDPLTGEIIRDDLEHVAIWPATHYNVKEGTMERAVAEIGHELNERTRRARGRGQAARVAPPAPAHAVRHGDAQGGRVLLGHRELLAHPGRPDAGLAAVLPDRLLPEGLRLLHRRVAPDGAADRRHVRGRPLAQVDAGRLRLPAAERDGQPPADVRRVPLDHAADGVRLGHAGRCTRRSTRRRWSSRSCARPGSWTRRSTCARPRTRSTT